jgi:hypothetical protein
MTIRIWIPQNYIDPGNPYRGYSLTSRSWKDNRFIYCDPHVRINISIILRVTGPICRATTLPSGETRKVVGNPGINPSSDFCSGRDLNIGKVMESLFRKDLNAAY